MRETEYRRRRKQLETELQVAKEKLTALDLLWKTHFSCEQGHENSASTDSDASKTEIVNGQAQLLIDDAVASMAGDFGVKEIDATIQSRHAGKLVNRTTIAGRLRKLVDDGKIEQVQAGIGRRPGKFKGRSAA